MGSRELAIPVDNDYYDRSPDAWWEPAQPLSLLYAVTPGRFAYMQSVLTDRLGVDLAGVAAVDIGCGGGLLAEEFARAGCRVIGIDPSARSLEVARNRAREVGLDIEYRQGVGEALPLPDESLDIAYCCDVLEHVADLDRVIVETARVLRPGGVFLYDTINRTLASKLVFIKLAQEWRPTRLIDFPLHDWNMFIKPEELLAILARHGFENAEMTGFGPRGNPLPAAVEYVRLKLSRGSFIELGRAARAGTIRNMNLSYVGYAVKR